jgi:hypothetical protein
MAFRNKSIKKMQTFQQNLIMLQCLEDRLQSNPEFAVQFAGSQAFAVVISSLYTMLSETRQLNRVICPNVATDVYDEMIKRLQSVNQTLNLKAIPTT